MLIPSAYYILSLPEGYLFVAPHGSCAITRKAAAWYVKRGMQLRCRK